MAAKHIYFDNNGTTLICNKSKTAMTKWLSCYNPSSGSSIALGAKKIIKNAVNAIEEHCNLCGKYAVIFTSGATESNCSIIRMIVDAYTNIFAEIPHIVSSAIEHKSIISCLKDLESANLAEITLVKPDIYGMISAKQVVAAIKKNTCLVSIMYANNEIGTINNIQEIAKRVHLASNKFQIPFHTDAVQLFGKCKINMTKVDIDVLSMSFHKLYGPKGIGLLIIKKNLIAENGFGLRALITGAQQHGLRGGTENVPAIAGALEAMKYTFKNRTEKNKHLLKLKNLLLELLAAKFYFADYVDYLTEVPRKKNAVELILLGPKNHQKNVLPNTILMAIVKNKGKKFCNLKFKRKMNRSNIFISIGSACLTDNASSSHVLHAINAPDDIRRGTIRISFGDTNTEAQVRKFVKIFCQVVSAF